MIWICIGFYSRRSLSRGLAPSHSHIFLTTWPLAQRFQQLVDGCYNFARCLATWGATRPLPPPRKVPVTNDVIVCPKLWNECGYWVLAWKPLRVGFHFDRVRFGEQVQQAIGEKLPGSVFSPFFGQTRCKKSPYMGFSTFCSHWIHLFFFLSIVKNLFVHFDHLMKMIHWKMDQEM